MYRLIIAGIGVLAIALLATGCGGGGSEDATVQVSKAQFIKQASAVCTKARKKREVALADWEEGASGQHGTASRDEGARKVFAPSLQREAEELGALPVPAGVAREVDQIVKDLSRVSAAIIEEGAKGIGTPALARLQSEVAVVGLASCP